VIPGRCRSGWRSLLANAAAFALLAAGTQFLARQSSSWNPAAWAAPWTGDVILVMAGLIFLGLAFLMPLQAGVLNLGIFAQFLSGFAVAATISRSTAIDPSARAFLALLAGSAAGALAGALMLWLKRQFAVHEVLSGLLLGGALAPLARAVSFAPSTLPALTFELRNLPGAALWTPGPGLGQQWALAGGIIVLALGVLIALVFGHVLRASALGFDLRVVGSNPLAAVAAGVDVETVQLWMLTAGGACAGLTGALQLWTHPAVALERWPLPLAFAGITIAAYGMASVRGVLLASILFALWLNAPGTFVTLAHPGWGTAVAALLILPVLWILPRILPDQGAPRALWRTRHRETY
jgi:general nucleoside transport system permease protein